MSDQTSSDARNLRDKESVRIALEAVLHVIDEPLRRKCPLSRESLIVALNERAERGDLIMRSRGRVKQYSADNLKHIARN